MSRILTGLIFLSFLSSPAKAADELAQSFTLDGQLSQKSSTQPLLDSSVKIVVQILDPSKNCLLYEEKQFVNTSNSNGYFNIQVGSHVGSSKRTTNDPARSMNLIFQNTKNITANNAPGRTCAGGEYDPQAGDARYFRLLVTPSSTGVEDTLAPDTVMDSVPTAIVAETLQGLNADEFIKVGTGDLDQTQMQNVFATGNAAKLTSLLSVDPSRYVTSNTNGALPLPSVSGNATGAVAGQFWYDTSANVIKYHNGSGVQTLGVSGSGITSLTAGTGLTGGTITNSGTIAVDVGTSANKIVQLDSSAKLPVVDGSQLTNLSGAAITGNISTAGNVSAAQGSFNQVSSGELSLFDHATTSTNYITLKTPNTATLTTNYTLTLPSAQATGANQLLMNDGTGLLSWTASPTAGGQVLRYNGSTWVPGVVAMTDLRSSVTGAASLASSCGANQTLTYNSVGDIMTCAPIAITGSQVSYGSQAQNTFFAAPSGSAGAPSFRTIAASDLPASVTDGVWGASGGNVYRTTGNVGIGTSGPSSLLTVAGTASISGAASFGSTISVNTANTADRINVGGNISTYGDGAGFLMYNVGANYTGNFELARFMPVSNEFLFQTLQGGTGVGRNLRFNVGSANILMQNSTGNVGIGASTSPRTKLDINTSAVDATSQVGTFVVTGVDTYGQTFTLQSPVSSYSGKIAQAYKAAGGAGGAMLSGVKFNNDAPDYFAVFDQSINPLLAVKNGTGNVGIGTTTPGEKLEVSGNVKATAFIGDGSQLTGIAASSSSTSSNATNYVVKADSDANGSGDINFQIGNTTKVQINNAGNMIVNNTTSSSSSTTGALVVSGGVGIAGNTNVGGNLSAGNRVDLGLSAPAASFHIGSVGVMLKPSTGDRGIMEIHSPTGNAKSVIQAVDGYGLFIQSLNTLPTIFDSNVGTGNYTLFAGSAVERGQRFSPSIGAAADVGLGRSGAGVLQVTDGSTGYGTLTAGSVQAGGGSTTTSVTTLSRPASGATIFNEIAGPSGAVTPGSTLFQVKGNTTMGTGGTIFSAYTSGNRGLRVSENGDIYMSNYATFTGGPATLVIGGSGNSNTFQSGNSAAQTNTDFLFKAGVADRTAGMLFQVANYTAPVMSITAETGSGKVGIGTTTPGSPLHVRSTASENTLFLSNPTGGVGNSAGIVFQNGNTTTNDYVKSGIFSQATVNGWGRSNLIFAINTANDSTNVTDSDGAMIIRDDKAVLYTNKVGIGPYTTSSTLYYPLHVRNDSSEQSMLLRRQTSANGQATGMIFNVASTSVDDDFYSKGGIFYERGTTGFGRGKLHFANNNAGDNSNVTSANASMSIIEDGSVGIGTTTPGEKLEVSGNVKATAFIGDGSQLTGIGASSSSNTTNYVLNADSDANGSGILNFQIGGVSKMQITNAGNVTISNTTASSSTTTGALTVAGGVGIAGNTNIGGALVATGDGTFLGDGSVPNAPAAAGFYFGKSASDTNRRMEIVTPVNGAAYIDFTNPNVDLMGRIIYWTNTNSMQFHTSNAARVTIDGSGNVGVNRSPASTAKLHVDGQVVSGSFDNGSSMTFDMSKGNAQYTSASCGAATLNNMVDGASYTIVIQGGTAGTCTFTDSAGSRTFKFAPTNGVTEAGKHTVYSMQVVGSFVYVSWIPGF